MNFKEKITKKNIFIGISLLLIFLLAFQVRVQPARFNELQALDPFYIYYTSQTYLENGFSLPEKNMLRNAPFGTDNYGQNFMWYAFPAFVYVIGGGWGLNYFNFALLFPAAMGALAVLIMFLIGRELYNWKAGLLSAFFLATVPVFITRTSAGFFEKEPVAGVFTLLTIWLFFRAYKKEDWKYGIFAGIALFLSAQSWGGVSYYIILLTSFSLILLLLNKYKKTFFAFVPMILTAIIINLPFSATKLTLPSTSSILSLGVVVLFIIRFLVEKKSLIKENQLKLISPVLIILLVVGVLIGSIFFDSVYDKVNDFGKVVGLVPGVDLSTVAESQPGSIQFVQSFTDGRFVSVPYLSNISIFFSVWLLSFIGLLVTFYLAYKKKEYLFLFPVIWFITAIWGVLGFIRLSFIIGPPFVLLASFPLAFLLEKSKNLNIIKNAIGVGKFLNYVSIPIIIILILMISINTINSFAYGSLLGPSICIVNPQGLIDGQKCLETDSQGNPIKYGEGQPWYQAMTFLREQTPENSIVHSWWDFGYWFQVRGERSTITDGGFGLRYETAIWFTDDYKNWNESFKWLKERGVKYILMDNTLIGKYGAISRIASEGKTADSFLPFSRSGKPSNIYNQNNKTILEYNLGGNTIWIPTINNSIVDAPIFFQSVGNQVTNRVFIDEVCTSAGIQKFPISGQDLGGCVSFSQHGVHYIQEYLKNNIFSRLMFMEGVGLPVNKVFDNSYIQIYEIEN